MPGLPVVSGRDLIKILSRLGYQLIRQPGSHARLKCSTSSGEHVITVPLHEEIPRAHCRTFSRKLLSGRASQKKILSEC
ncbi:MAG: type II toxin-antitoxin system HicA family toxin [Methanolinea sp.]|nr:type II toxin-antitoxin system HicA family toxin [Methanolinea sp.]